MAIPENRGPNEPRTYVDDLGDQRVVEREARGGWRWWWVWPVIIALVLWWAGWGWGSSGGWWWGRSHAQNTAIPAPNGARTTETLANAGAQQPVTGAGARPLQMTGTAVPVLEAQNKKPYVGEQVQVDYAMVHKKVNDHAMWIGGTTPMLAVVNGNADKTANKIDQGKLVDATGTVKKAPSETQAKNDWKLSDQDAQRLEKEGAYIEVSQLTLPQQ